MFAVWLAYRTLPNTPQLTLPRIHMTLDYEVEHMFHKLNQFGLTHGFMSIDLPEL